MPSGWSRATGLLAAAVLIASVAGCAAPDEGIEQLADELAGQQHRIDDLQDELDERERTIAEQAERIEELEAAAARCGQT